MSKFRNFNLRNTAKIAWNKAITGAKVYGNAVRAGFRGTTLPTNYSADMIGVATQAGYMTGQLAKGIKIGANTVWVRTKPALKTIGNGLYAMGKYVVRVAAKVLNGVKGWLIKVLGTIGKFSKSAAARIKRGFADAGTAVRSGWRSFKPKAKKALGGAVGKTVAGAKNIANKIDGAYVKVADRVTKPLRPKSAVESKKHFEYRQLKRDMAVRNRATALETATAILAYEGIKRWDSGNSKEDGE